MTEKARLNREAGYAEASVAGQHMKLGFLRHALMISRLHYMLEMSCRNSEGKVSLAAGPAAAYAEALLPRPMALGYLTRSENSI